MGLFDKREQKPTNIWTDIELPQPVFRESMRGYNPADVDKWIAQAIQVIEGFRTQAR